MAQGTRGGAALRFSALGERSDLDEAEEILHEAISLVSPRPQQAELLAQLGAVYGLRYALTSEPADMTKPFLRSEKQSARRYRTQSSSHATPET